MAATKLLILNGPGLANLAEYHAQGFADISLECVRDACTALCEQWQISLDFRQTDDQEQLCQWITQDSDGFDALLINPASASCASTVDGQKLHDAVEGIAGLNSAIYEVHIGKLLQADNKASSPLQVAQGQIGFISGLGLQGYLLAIKAIHRRFEE